MAIFRWIDAHIMKGIIWAMTTRSAFYLLSLLILTVLIISPPKDLYGWLVAAVTIYYQGAGLAGLGAATRYESDKTQNTLQETHDVTMESHDELHEKLDRILALLEQKEGK